MTDTLTPRTDSAVFSSEMRLDKEVVFSSVARQLETELTTALADREHMIAVTQELRERLSFALVELAAIASQYDGAVNELNKTLVESAKWKADAGRYRWLREIPNADALNLRYMGVDLDMIIDAAMKGQKP